MAQHPIDPSMLFAAIVRSSEDAIVSKDLNSIVTSWNPAAERMFGYPAAEMIGKSIRLIIPDDRQDEEDLVLGRIRAGESVEHFETVRQRKNGSTLHIALSVSPVRNASGQIVGASKIARDISDRKRAEELAERTQRRTAFLARLGASLAVARDREETVRTIVEVCVPEIADWCALDTLGSDGQIEAAAAAHVNPDKVPLAEYIHRRYAHRDSPYGVLRAIRTGKHAFVPEITKDLIGNAAAGDPERTRLVTDLDLVSYMCLPLVSRGNTFGAMTLATADSGRRWDDDDLRFAQEIAARSALAIDNAVAFDQLAVANRLKEEFLATLSHELRTPLNAILGYARMLRAGILAPSKLEGALEIVERNAESLTQIVEDVLDVSRIASGKIRLNVQPIELAQVVGDAVATVRPAVDAKAIQVHMAIEPDAGRVTGDPDRLRQVVWNILSNAVKFTPNGGQILIRLGRVESQVEISVADTGVGISAEFLPHIFERFRQADSGTTRAQGGLGLGLSIARQLVELHGGTIQAMSDGEGQGTTFKIRLPLMSATTPMSMGGLLTPSPPARRLAGIGLQDLVGIRVLAVDDDPDALSLIREILEAAGADVLMASDARSALLRLQEGSPDVLISDVGMPLMDGFELIERIRRLEDARHRSTPAAALTAYARSEDRVKSLHSGFQMHLSKPIDPSELVGAVASLAGRAGVSVRE